MLLILAWRNLWRNSRRTLITVSSVLFAFMLATALISFARGFQQQMIETMVRQETGYLQIQDAQYFDQPSLDHTLEYGDEVRQALEAHQDEIEYTVPRIQGFSLAAKGMSTRPALVTGILPQREDKLRKLSANMVEGELFSDRDESAVIGEGLAGLLGLSVGDTLILIGQGYQAMTATGKFRIGGIISFAIPERNNTAVYLPLERAQWYFVAENRLTNLIIMPKDTEHIGPLANDLQSMLDREWYSVAVWEELMPDVMGIIQMQDTVYTGIAWVFYIIVGFGIFGTVLTMFYERMQEFGILLSVGMKRRLLSAVGMLETIMIGIMGIVAGALVSLPIVYLFQRFPIRFSGEMANYVLQFGVEPIFPFILDAQIFLTQAVSIFSITLFIGVITTIKIMRINIQEAVRNE